MQRRLCGSIFTNDSILWRTKWIVDDCETENGKCEDDPIENHGDWKEIEFFSRLKTLPINDKLTFNDSLRVGIFVVTFHALTKSPNRAENIKNRLGQNEYNFNGQQRRNHPSVLRIGNPALRTSVHYQNQQHHINTNDGNYSR